MAALTIASASAENIYISGATAYRGSANEAIASLATITTSNNATLASASLLKATFTDTNGTHNIYVRWTGSEGGIQSCAGPRTGTNAVTVNFYNENVTNGLVTGSTNNAKVTDIAFSDTYQSTSLFQGGKKAFGISYTALLGVNNTHGIVGVNQFAFITGSNSPVSNISSMQARTLLGNGEIRTRLITGDTNDTSGCWLVGRNSDSGTRLSVLGEVGYGANTAPQQYRINSKSQIQIWPAETINRLALTPGQSGYDSGGTIAQAFTNSTYYPLDINVSVGKMVNSVDENGDETGEQEVAYAASKYATNYVIGYAGAGDALASSSGAARANIKVLSFNGVPFTMENIQNGTYSLWTYEHLYYNPAASATARAVATAIFDRCALLSSARNAAVKSSTMNCTRSGDAKPVISNY